MSNLFMPKEQDDLDLLSFKPTAKFTGPTVLAFVAGLHVFALEDFDSKPKSVAVRDKCVNDICLYGGKLYDGGDYCRVFETLGGMNVFDTGDERVLSLGALGNSFYAGTGGGAFYYMKEGEVLNSRVRVSHVDYVNIESMAFNEEEFCYAGYNEEATKYEIWEGDSAINSGLDSAPHFCVHEGKIYNSYMHSVFDTLNDKPVVFDFPHRLKGVFSFDLGLYIFDKAGNVYIAGEEKPIFHYPSFSRAIEIPRKLVEDKLNE